MIQLTKTQVLRMHDALISATGGTVGVRDDGLLEAALAAPFMTFDGNALHPELLEKAAVFGYGLIKNHALVDGNKRIGAHAMLVCLALSGIRLHYTQAELVDIIMSIAAGESSQEKLLEWLKLHQMHADE